MGFKGGGGKPKYFYLLLMGLEPISLSTMAPRTTAFTNFATRALFFLYKKPLTGIEPATFCLPYKYSTTEI